jgi:ABC-type amino acid transport substrate-binding protein
VKLVAHLLSGFHVWPKWYLAFGLVCLAALAGTLVLLMRPAAPQTLRVAYDEFYPYVGLDGAGGPTGLAVQVVREAAARAGIPLVWVRVTDAEAALRSGQADLFPLLTVTPERRRDWYFSVPWWES